MPILVGDDLVDGLNPISDEEAYMHSFVMSVFNGLLSMLIVMAKRGHISPAELKSLHDSMSKPLAMSQISGNEMVADLQSRIDELLGEVARYMKQGPIPPDEKSRQSD